MLRLLESDDSDDSVTEHALIARIVDGDRAAFEQLALAVMAALLSYAFRLVHTRETAEDIVQEVLLWVWQHRASLQVKGSVRSYLFAIVRHRALDNLRHARAEAGWDTRYAREDVLPGMSEPIATPEAHTEHRDAAAALRRAIDELPARQRQIVLLRWRQLTSAEIAQSLGISVKTVEVQITRAYATLRNKLRPWAE